MPGLAASAALAAVGGPMKDIPFAVLRQIRLAPRDLAAGVRAYIAANSAGTLVAMLLAPALLEHLSPAAVTFLCGATMAATGATGLFRHQAHQEARVMMRQGRPAPHSLTGANAVCRLWS